MGGSEAAGQAGTGIARESCSSVFLKSITKNEVIAAFIETNMNFIEETFMFKIMFLFVAAISHVELNTSSCLLAFFGFYRKTFLDMTIYSIPEQLEKLPLGHLDDTALRV